MVEKRATFKFIYNTRRIGYCDLATRLKGFAEKLGVTVLEYKRNLDK